MPRNPTVLLAASWVCAKFARVRSLSMVTSHGRVGSRLDSTPDLVLDLPARPDARPDTRPDALAADTFAHNRDTLKKRPAVAAHRYACRFCASLRRFSIKYVIMNALAARHPCDS
ncbi:jg12903 [Pararge aegeria aegeria]|uniref:Jg12903 protein n=1 Tax=Pararge aegeria aegeria TaxID=348720 RepID=A0A8S4QKP2_9NEOP|nr:jg12903 [Pararge aegeria aegeria]